VRLSAKREELVDSEHWDHCYRRDGHQPTNSLTPAWQNVVAVRQRRKLNDVKYQYCLKHSKERSTLHRLVSYTEGLETRRDDHHMQRGSAALC